MQLTNIYEAKTHFSQLIDKVCNGEEIIIGKAGKPVAKLVPFKPTKQARKPGCWKGKVKISKDFNTLPKEIFDSFYGKD